MITSSEMRRLEDLSEKNGVTKLKLMENAGLGMFKELDKKYKLENKKTLIVCGSGNNGGDGFVLARYMIQSNYNVKVLFLGKKETLKNSKSEFFGHKKSRGFLSELKKESSYNYYLLQDMNPEVFVSEFIDSDIIVDAMFGTGIKGEIREPYLSMIDKINNSNKIVISVDIPSGMNPDSGECKKCVNPELIITFHDIKIGLKDLENEIIIVNIGL